MNADIGTNANENANVYAWDITQIENEPKDTYWLLVFSVCFAGATVFNAMNSTKSKKELSERLGNFIKTTTNFMYHRHRNYSFSYLPIHHNKQWHRVIFIRRNDEQVPKPQKQSVRMVALHLKCSLNWILFFHRLFVTMQYVYWTARNTWSRLFCSSLNAPFYCHAH